jgi:DNA gyrase subunit B
MSNYNASEITVLEGLEAVRKRPGMYIGNTGKEGLHKCIDEIADNSVDECMAGYGKTIKVVLTKYMGQSAVVVTDDGRGIPTDIHAKTGKSALETIMTVLHAGGKFDQKNYQFSGGLHGVGASVVNALSVLMEIWVLRENVIYYIQFSKGKVVVDIAKMTYDEFANKYPEIATNVVWTIRGTATRFVPDFTIFEAVDFDAVEINESLKKTAYLNKNIRLIFENQTKSDNGLDKNLALELDMFEM